LGRKREGGGSVGLVAEKEWGRGWQGGAGVRLKHVSLK
jgi:hypothetical protein